MPEPLTEEELKKQENRKDSEPDGRISAH